MIEGCDIICFANDWESDPLSKKHVMQRLGRKNRILWVNSIGNRNPTASVRDLRRAAQKAISFFGGMRQVDHNIHTISPLVIPFHGARLARKINRWLLVLTLRTALWRLGFQRPIVWTFLPSSADVIGHLGERLVVYHCTDEFSEFTGTARNAILEVERALIEKADRVIVSAERLYSSKVKHNPATWLVRHGVDVEHFRQACDPATAIPEDIAGIPGFVVGFFGLIADWVDLNLIREAALARRQCSFVLIGKVDTDIRPISDLPNVYLLGQKPYSELPGYCRRFDMAMLPFAVNELTLNANPLKLREYLAAGLTVVSTPIPEVQRFKRFVRIAHDSSAFIRHLDELLAAPSVGPNLTVSREMDAESWDEKVEEMSRAIQHDAQPQPIAGGI
jgi:hypothetical protein